MTIYKAKKYKKQQFGQHQQVMTHNNGKPKTDYRDQINVNEKFYEYQRPFEKMLTKYEAVRNGHLGNISITKQLVKLSKRTCAIYSPPYRAGPRLHLLEMKSQQNNEEQRRQACRHQWSVNFYRFRVEEGR